MADTPLGPWRDAHPAGPIISQAVPVANRIQNIDPTRLVDDDGRVFIFWGTFGRLRGMELARDMTTPAGPETTITGLTGFFEAPWIMKRRGTYYMLYAGNAATHFEVARFPEVTTKRLRAVFGASRRGNDIAGVAVQEWEVLAAPSSR